MADNVIELTDETFDSTIQGSSPVLVDFWAPWCGPCKMLTPVIEEIAGDYAGKATGHDQEKEVYPQIMQTARELAGRLFGVTPTEIALVGPTSLALSYVAGGIDWSPGDNVLVYFEDYPSNVYPWMALAEKGVNVRYLETPELGTIRAEDVLRQVDDRTRLVSLASCHFRKTLKWP